MLPVPAPGRIAAIAERGSLEPEEPAPAPGPLIIIPPRLPPPGPPGVPGAPAWAFGSESAGGLAGVSVFAWASISSAAEPPSPFGVDSDLGAGAGAEATAPAGA